ncbi:MAG: chemotaxis protein CheA, partial [Coleofasciculus sp. S288]|nr:chemotaxis protein CheA [Coleofasciculus sp. S288]
MAINSDIRDQAYQFFIEEAPELLQAIEAGLLALKQERSTALVHTLMRAAHSLKGGAASVDLDAIATLAHRLENIFRVFYSEALDIDSNIESQLLSAYDCLRLPLMDQIAKGSFDVEQALAVADSIFPPLEERFKDALIRADNYIPSSAELGVDMTQSIFEVDVAQGLEHLTKVVAHPEDYEVAGELRVQAQVFAGFAELLNQTEFGAIAKATLAALDAYPHCALEIAQLAIADFQLVRQAVLVGNTPHRSVSAALLALANSTATTIPAEDTEDAIPLLEDVFGNTLANIELDAEELFAAVEVPKDTQIADEERKLEETFTTASEFVFGITARSSEGDADASDSPTIIDVEWLANTPFVTEEAEEEPSLEDLFSGAIVIPETETEPKVQVNQLNVERFNLQPSTPETLEAAVESIEQIFESLPPLQNPSQLTSESELTGSKTASNGGSLVPARQPLNEIIQASQSAELSTTASNERKQPSTQIRQDQGKAPVTHNLSVRVDSERLERMNNLVGELAINRNGLSLQNEQLQASVRELRNRFARVRGQVGHLRKLSDQMLVAPLRHDDEIRPSSVSQLKDVVNDLAIAQANFDALELDTYGALYSRLQGLLEDMMQLEESVDDIVLFARQSDQTLEQQRQMLTQLRDELMWSRMLPLGEVLNRFPRMLRDLSNTYGKPVSLKLSGTSVLVDKAVLEKLYDPLLHLLRNAFDHGIESPEIRRQKGKSEQGQIEIHAYHRGSKTIIEVSDNGQGLNLERIGRRAVELGWLSTEQLAKIPKTQLMEFIFEPGFSTAAQVSELSGRGVGLDVVRQDLRSLKGSLVVTSSPGVGTTFTLKLPLTLTIAKLLVCFVNSTALALPSDNVEEIVIPKAEQTKQLGKQRFLRWRGELIPAYRLADLLSYACPIPSMLPSKALATVPFPQDWTLPMLVLRLGTQTFALEVERLITEQELVIKPFGSAIAPPSFTYGCTILGDGRLV